MADIMGELTAWVREGEAQRGANFQGYVHGISQARYVIRKVFHIADDEAKRAGLDPLEHHALLQVFGNGDTPLTVSALGERLVVAPAFASRLIKELETKGYVARRRSVKDRRVIWVEITREGIELLRSIDANVHTHVDYFQKQLTDEQRLAALAIFAFYVGLGSDSAVGELIVSELEGADAHGATASERSAKAPRAKPRPARTAARQRSPRT